MFGSLREVSIIRSNSEWSIVLKKEECQVSRDCTWSQIFKYLELLNIKPRWVKCLIFLWLCFEITFVMWYRSVLKYLRWVWSCTRSAKVEVSNVVFVWYEPISGEVQRTEDSASTSFFDVHESWGQTCWRQIQVIISTHPWQCVLAC